MSHQMELETAPIAVEQKAATSRESKVIVGLLSAAALAAAVSVFGIGRPDGTIHIDADPIPVSGIHDAVGEMGLSRADADVMERLANSGMVTLVGAELTQQPNMVTFMAMHRAPEGKWCADVSVAEPQYLAHVCGPKSGQGPRWVIPTNPNGATLMKVTMTEGFSYFIHEVGGGVEQTPELSAGQSFVTTIHHR